MSEERAIGEANLESVANVTTDQTDVQMRSCESEEFSEDEEYLSQQEAENNFGDTDTENDQIAPPCESDEKNYNIVEQDLTEEELDLVADTTIEVLRMILKYFNAEDAEIDEYEGEEGELILDIVGSNLAPLIGRHGKTLDSLQFLISTIVSKKIGFRYPVVIDIEGYKQRRKQKIVGQAKATALKAIKQKREISMHPMNPYERRLIHVALKDERRVTTHSEGVEPDRCVIVRPV